MSIIGLDPQANGWRDDGTESGVIRTDAVHGNLVMVPFQAARYASQAIGATASYQRGITYNPDGSGTAINVSVPTGSNGVRIFQLFEGSTFGLRYRANLLTQRVDAITVSVDGVPVTFNPEAALADLNLESSQDMYFGHTVTHRDLPEGTHLAEIVLTSGPATRSIVLLGYLADQAAGYSPPTRFHQMVIGGAVGTSFSYVKYGDAPEDLAAISRIAYSNSTESPITVTLSYIGSTDFATVTVPANGTAAYDFGFPTANARLVQHRASASGVTHVTLGVV